MKKKILTLVTGSMLAASIGMAAPITDLQEGQSNIGYNHYNLNSAGYSIDGDSFYLENGVTNKVIVGIEKNSYSIPGYDSNNTTDVYAHYKVDENIQLIVGNRDYSYGPNKMYYGIGATTNLAPKVDGYASVTSSSIATEWQTGVNYKMDSQNSLHLGYKSYKQDGAATLDGIGFGINHKF